MATQVPEVYATPDTGSDDPAQALQGDDMIGHQRLHTILLSAIHKKLTETQIPFRIQVPAGVTNQLAVAVLSAGKGEILTVQNPTAAPITVDLYENDGGNTVLKVQVPAFAYQALYVPFFGRLFARAGAGMILSGHVTGD